MPAPHQPALAVAGAQLVERQLEHLVDLGLLQHPGEAGLDHADERIDRVVGDERRRRRQRADHVDGVRRQADLLVRLAQRGVDAAPRRASRRPPGNEISPAWRRRSWRRRVKTACSAAVVLEDGHEHGGVAAAVHVHGQRLVAAPSRTAASSLGGAQASSTRSSNMTSPSSVRWTGHLAAITCSCSICSSSRCGGHLEHELELRRAAALGRRVLDVDREAAGVPALALGVHLHRDRRAGGERRGQQLLRARALVLAAGLDRLVDREGVVAGLHVVGELLALAGDGAHRAGVAASIEESHQSNRLNTMPVSTLGKK